MNKKFFFIALLSLLSVGCASVPMESADKANVAKQYAPPSDGKAGLYIFRSNSVGGAALKKDIWIDGECLGQTARGVFFYEEVEGGQEHKISTESEFSPNDLLLKTVAGNLYFIQQYIKLGVFVGGAGLKLVEEGEGKEKVKGLGLATKGECSQPNTTAQEAANNY